MYIYINTQNAQTVHIYFSYFVYMNVYYLCGILLQKEVRHNAI
nr:MAG TPA: hypothetical protein [Caudoviricetes sp.]